ncbi:hypothetical protein SEA_UZUMAKI_47 [Arthrobacter phage Uzumaki]|nr:hypothetical protein SEA_UZUMAKI_47 [Arthrobacter phage Uzumaki]
MKTGSAFIAGVVTTLVAIPVSIVYVKPIRVGFTNGICKLASLGLRLAPPEEQRDFLNTVMDIAKDFEKENNNA